jgi:L-rhamnose-H+ transport protein
LDHTAGIGLAFVLLGGVFQGSFVLPMKRMPDWHWENTWLVYSVVGMVALPCLLVAATIPHPLEVLKLTSTTVLAEVALFGFGWGVGSTLFGLGIDRVGLGLGFAIILGVTASLGSLLPLVILNPQRLLTRQGYALIAGLILVLGGIVLCSIAGGRRERETASAKRPGGSRFWIGLALCVASGVFSPMLNFSFVFGKELQGFTLKFGAQSQMASNLVWALALGAGFLANAGYCVYLLRKNRTWGSLRPENAPSAYWLGSFLMGFLWFAGIVVYGMGAAGLGALGAVIGWPLFMAMIIVTANVWGALAGEWKGSLWTTHVYSWSGIAVLLLAIGIISRGSPS